jgi:hypothetical protein
MEDILIFLAMPTNFVAPEIITTERPINATTAESSIRLNALLFFLLLF